MAFISLIFAFIFIILVGAVVFSAFIFLIVGILQNRRYKKPEYNGKKRIYPKVLIALGLIVLVPFTIIVTYLVIQYNLQQAKQNKNLFYCLVNEKYEKAQKLIDNGASPERIPDTNTLSNEAVPDGEETLLLHFCRRGSCSTSYSKTVSFLIKNGADINHREWIHEKNHPEHSGSSQYGFEWGDYCGSTPLMCALGTGDIESAKVLIDAGADVNARDYCGRTPLIYAAKSISSGGDYESMAKLLTEHGADTDVTDNFGQSVQDYLEHFDYSK